MGVGSAVEGDQSLAIVLSPSTLSNSGSSGWTKSDSGACIHCTGQPVNCADQVIRALREASGADAAGSVGAVSVSVATARAPVWPNTRVSQ
jgi:hypothetical protein